MESSYKWEEVERPVFDERSFTIEAAVDEIAETEYMVEEEVRERFSEESLYEYSAKMRDRELEEELRNLIGFFDADKSGVRTNPNAKNRVLVRGSAHRWDGTSMGITIYPDLKSALDTSPWRHGSDNILADCEIKQIWDVNGALFVRGAHHDGEVVIEVLQLSDKGEAVLDDIDYADGFCIPEEGIEAMGKVHTEGMEDELIADLADDPELCPVPRYMERFYGTATLHFRAVDPDDETINLTVWPEPGKPRELFLAIGTGNRELPAPLAEKLEGQSSFKDFEDAVEQCRLVYGAACDRG